METNPFKQSNEVPDDFAEAAMAQELATTYLDTGAKKLQTLATIIGGEKAGNILSGERIKLIFAVIGGISSWNYLSKKGRENWKYVILGTLAIISARYILENKDKNNIS